MKPRRRDVLTFVAALMIGGAASMGFQYFRPLGERLGRTPMVEDILADPDAPRVGPAQAPLTIVAYSDYDCPTCRLSYFAMQSAIAGRRDIRIIHKEWPTLGPNSMKAARIALAAGDQGIYARLHDLLMRRDGRIDDETLRAAVEQAGGDWEKIRAELAANSDRIDEQIARNSTEAFALGLRGTPAYLVGPVLVRGGLNEPGFRQVLREAGAR